MEKLKGIKLQRGQKILVIFIAAFVLAALIFAIVFGAIMAARRAMAVVRKRRRTSYPTISIGIWAISALRAYPTPRIRWSSGARPTRTA